MRLSHGRQDGAPPGPIEIAKSTVAVTIAVRAPVFLPQQQQGHAAPLEFPVHLAKRLGRRFLKRRWREQPPLQLAVVHALRHRPGDANDSGPPQILADRRTAYPNRHRDLPLAHPKGVAQSQNFSNLAHRRSLGGHRTSPCLVAKEAASAIRSPTARASHHPHRVAGLHRNGWPTSVGIGGRFASDWLRVQIGPGPQRWGDD